MGYVIAAIIVVLIVAAAVGLFVRSATSRKGQAAIAAPDEGTPLGDTDQVSEPNTAPQPAGTTDPTPGVGGPGEGGAGGEGEGSRPVSEDLANPPR
jgi:hypothetical protein